MGLLEKFAPNISGAMADKVLKKYFESRGLKSLLITYTDKGLKYTEGVDAFAGISEKDLYELKAYIHNLQQKIKDLEK